MKNNVKIKVKPARQTRKERKNARFAAKAKEQLILYRQAAEFHKAYLEIELGAEEAYLNALQACLAALQPTAETVVVTEEEIETVQEPEETFVFEEESNKPVEEW